MMRGLCEDHLGILFTALLRLGCGKRSADHGSYDVICFAGLLSGVCWATSLSYRLTCAASFGYRSYDAAAAISHHSVTVVPLW